MIITNGQLHNAQIINAAGQIVGTTPIQSALTTAQMQPTIQLVQTSKSRRLFNDKIGEIFVWSQQRANFLF